jgi:hypothetical protein
VLKGVGGSAGLIALSRRREPTAEGFAKVEIRIVEAERAGRLGLPQA